MKRHLLALSLLAALSACKPADTPAPVAEAAAPANAPVAAPVETVAPRSAAMPFTVEVGLSEKARARLAAPADTVIVSATYFADAAPAATSQANDVGQIDLGKAQVELPSTGTANFDGSALQQDRLALTQGAPQVNLNVYSGRKSSPDNLLDCGMFQDAVAVAAKAPIKIECKLISETP